MWRPANSDSKRTRVIALHLYALVNLAIAQPLLNLIALEPVLLMQHRARPWEVVLVAACVSVLLPLAWILLVLIAGKLLSRYRLIFVLLSVFTLLAAIALPAWKRTNWFSWEWLIATGLVTAAAATWAYWRWAALRLFVSYASVIALLTPAWFLLQPRMRSLLFPAPAAPVTAAPLADRAPLVMFILDEFPLAALLNKDRQINARMFPNFARLANQSTSYRNATSVAGYTVYALPALLTGRMPQDRPPSFANYPSNLFTLLTPHYKSTIFEPFTQLHPPQQSEPLPVERLTVLGRELARLYAQFLLPGELAPLVGYWDPRDSERWGVESERRKSHGLIRYHLLMSRDKEFEHFLRTIRPADEPVFYFQHLLLPHQPYDYLPSGRTHGNRMEQSNGYWIDDPWHVAQQQQQFLLQLAYTDTLLGRLLDRLEETGLHDRCLLVVVVDHGMAFQSTLHGRDATLASAAEIMWIPLFIKLPHQAKGAVSDRNVESIDVLPTVCDLLQIPVPWPMEGQSAVGSAPERPTKTMFRGWDPPLSFAGDFPEKHGALASFAQWFDMDGGVEELYRIGPHKELLGRSLSELPVQGEARVRVQIANRLAWKDVKPSDAQLPCFLDGTVDQQAVSQGPLNLAIAVNGRIEAVTRTYLPKHLQQRWQALVPESAVRDGYNELRVLVVRSSASGVVLEPTILLQ